MTSGKSYAAGALACVAFVACGGNVTSDGTQGGTGGSSGAPSGGSCDPGHGAPCLPDPGSSTCASVATAIAAKVDGGACTTVVRVDPAKQWSVLDYEIRCGKYQLPPDEASAREIALAETGFGSECGSSVLHGTAEPESIDEVLLFHATTFTKCACCGDGWIAAVSAQSGLSVFGAGLPIFGGTTITFPASWNPASELGSGCSSETSLPPVRGFFLASEETTPPELDPAMLANALASVFATPLPRAIGEAGHEIANAVVLEYPMFGPGSDIAAKNGAVVLLNSFEMGEE